jgi:hypothetical protein
MKKPDDAEANLAAQVRRGTVPITRTGLGTVPSKIKQPDQEPQGEGAQTEAEGSGTWTAARREIQFFDEEPRDSGTNTPARSARREIQFSDEVSESPEATVAK